MKWSEHQCVRVDQSLGVRGLVMFVVIERVEIDQTMNKEGSHNLGLGMSQRASKERNSLTLARDRSVIISKSE